MFWDQCRLSIRGIMEAHHGQTGRGEGEVTCLTNPLKNSTKRYCGCVHSLCNTQLVGKSRKKTGEKSRCWHEGHDDKFSNHRKGKVSKRWTLKCVFYRWERKRKLEQWSTVMWQCRTGCPVPRWAAQVPQQVLTAVTCLTPSSITRSLFPSPSLVPFFNHCSSFYWIPLSLLLRLFLLRISLGPRPSPMTDPRWTDVSISEKFFIFGLAHPPLLLPLFNRRLDNEMLTCVGQYMAGKKSVTNSEQRQQCLQTLETTGQLQIDILRIKATTRNPSLVTVTYG